MKRSIKLLSLFLALLFIAASFSACGKEAGGEGGTTAGEAVEDKFFLSASSKSCNVYYPDSYKDTNLYSSAMALASLMETRAGIDTEYLPYSEYVDNGAPAIFVGNTGHEAAISFVNSVKYSDYGYSVIGRNLFVCANSTSAYTKLSNALLEVLEKSKGADLTLTPEDNFMHKGDYGTATVNGADIDSFKLVYASETFEKAVNSMLGEIGKSTGAIIEASLGADTPASEYEILVGNVGRDITNEFYGVNGSYSDYTVKISGKTISILARDDLSLECGLDAFGKLFKENAKSGKTLALTDDSTFTGSFYENSKLKLEARPEGTDIRIAANNVYFHQSSDIEKIDYRNPILLESIKYMDADILLLQEVNPKWHSVLDKLLESELKYTVVPTSTEITPVLDGRANYTPIWYRADKLELVDYGYKQYETVKLEPDSYLSSSKSYTWALFKDKATGKEIITVSTHFTWAPEDFNPTPDQCRTMDAQEVVDLVKQLEAEYAGVPVILMGDLNCQEGSNPYKKLSEVFSNVTKVTEKNNEMYKGTTHSVGSSSVGGAVIDHTLYTGDSLNFKMYQHVYNEWSFNSTDHIPLVLDVEFK